MSKQGKPEVVRIRYKPHVVHRSPGKHTGYSYMITIPKPFAERMELDRPGSYVVTTLVEEEMNHENHSHSTSSNNMKGKKKKIYCIVEKLYVT